MDKKMYWVYCEGKFMSMKEIEELYESGFPNENPRRDVTVRVAVYKMMPKANRPQFEYDAEYGWTGFCKSVTNK